MAEAYGNGKHVHRYRVSLFWNRDGICAFADIWEENSHCFRPTVLQTSGETAVLLKALLSF